MTPYSFHALFTLQFWPLILFLLALILIISRAINYGKANNSRVTRDCDIRVTNLYHTSCMKKYINFQSLQGPIFRILQHFAVILLISVCSSNSFRIHFKVNSNAISFPTLPLGPTCVGIFLLNTSDTYFIIFVNVDNDVSWHVRISISATAQLLGAVNTASKKQDIEIWWNIVKLSYIEPIPWKKH